jgi:hypothetical protein
LQARCLRPSVSNCRQSRSTSSSISRCRITACRAGNSRLLSFHEKFHDRPQAARTGCLAAGPVRRERESAGPFAAREAHLNFRCRTGRPASHPRDSPTYPPIFSCPKIAILTILGSWFASQTSDVLLERGLYKIGFAENGGASLDR